MWLMGVDEQGFMYCFGSSKLEGLMAGLGVPVRMPWLSPSQQPALYNNPLEGRLGGYYPCRDITMSRPPYFHALATFFCKSNRLYRIYVRPDELVFIWAGKGGEGTAGSMR